MSFNGLKLESTRVTVKSFRLVSDDFEGDTEPGSGGCGGYSRGLEEDVRVHNLPAGGDETEGQIRLRGVNSHRAELAGESSNAPPERGLVELIKTVAAQAVDEISQSFDTESFIDMIVAAQHGVRAP